MELAHAIGSKASLAASRVQIDQNGRPNIRVGKSGKCF